MTVADSETSAKRKREGHGSEVFILRRIGRGLGAIKAPAGALGVSLLVGAVVVYVSGGNPLSAYAALFDGALGSGRSIGRTLQNATPLILTGLAVAFPFRAGLFNIGGEGQFFLGAVVAAWLGVAVVAPFGLGVIAAVTAAAGVGGILAGVAGWLKARYGAHEVITTIMLNFIAINVAYMLLTNTLGAGTTLPGSEEIPATNRVPPIAEGLGAAHWGLLVALMAAVVAYIILWWTPIGFEVRVVGQQTEAAGYAGISVSRNTVLTMLIGGSFAGLAGAVEVLGTYGRMTVPFVTELGFTGIGVALLGKNHPLGCVLGGLVFGALAAGGQNMQLSTGISLKLVLLLTGVLLLFVTVERLPGMARRWRRRFNPGTYAGRS